MSAEQVLLIDRLSPSTPSVVWSDGAISLEEGTVRETRDYIVQLTSEQFMVAEARLFIDDLELEALRAAPRMARWSWSPGFYAGAADFEIRVPGRRDIRFRLITDPQRDKLTRRQFRVMLREILEETTSLFRISGFRMNVAKGNRTRNPPLARISYLLSMVRELEETVRAIAARPDHALGASSETKPLRRCSGGITPRELGRSLNSANPVFRLTRPGKRSIPIPLTIRKDRRRADVNLPEHVFIKACLHRWAEQMRAYASELDGNKRADEGEPVSSVWSRRCRAMASQLDMLRDLTFFDDIRNDRALSFQPSERWRRVPVYARFAKLYHELELGISNVEGNHLELPLSRTYDLYELWTFFKILEAGRRIFGDAHPGTSEIFDETVAGSGIARLKKEPKFAFNAFTKIAFQRRYREYWKTDQESCGSFTRVMIPDIALTHTASTESTQKLIVLDAKYRIGDGLNDALSSLHMYRDAIVFNTGDDEHHRAVSAAYVLAPFVPDGGVPQGSVSWKQVQMPCLLFHPAYRSKFKFGALTLIPEQPMSAIVEGVRSLLADAEIPMAKIQVL